MDTTVLTGGGLYYSGRPTLQIGAYGAVEHGLSKHTTPFGQTGDPTVHYGQFSIRYYFDTQ